MKQDLDHLMAERGLDAAVVSGLTYGNPTLIYILNGAAVSGGIVVKKRGEQAAFIHSPIERDEAVASGLRLINRGKYNMSAILEEKGNMLDATVELYRRIFAELDVHGEVAFYGMSDQGRAYLLLRALEEALPDIHVCAEYEEGLFDVARATKDADEIAQVRQVARLTCEVVAETVEFLRRHPVREETLVNADGKPLTVGQVKQHIHRLLAERELEDPEGVIFAIGRDAGVPHSKGRADDPLRLGQTIVYDLYPRAPSGYFFDVTRTFCLGYAPPEVERAYQDVADCLDGVIGAVRVGVETKQLQRVACTILSGRGHATIAENPQTEEGYNHVISHGLGLAVHEEPNFADASSNHQTLQPGHLFTVEPGVYYPSRGYGVRLEDVVWLDETGQLHNLTPLPKQLVVDI